MARRLVLMPVLPSVTMSEAENFWPRVCSASALRMDLGNNQAAPAALTERMRKSRRRMRPPEDGGVFMRLHQEGCGVEDWSSHHRGKRGDQNLNPFARAQGRLSRKQRQKGGARSGFRFGTGRPAGGRGA